MKVDATGRYAPSDLDKLQPSLAIMVSRALGTVGDDGWWARWRTEKAFRVAECGRANIVPDDE